METYFWQAPEDYVGNKLVSYGQSIRIKTSWHTGRGDTAGISTKGPDIVLEVSNMHQYACFDNQIFWKYPRLLTKIEI